jgi:hypothetical protein
MASVYHIRVRAFKEVAQHLSPVTLAAISVELESAERNNAANEFLDAVNSELDANCGPEEAEQHRQWVRDNF